MPKNYYFKSHGLLLALSPEWEWENYRYMSNGIGDAVGRSSKAALAYNDSEILQLCVELLKAGKRWPDELNPPPPYPKKFPGAKAKIRSQFSITRDPIIGTCCALWLFGPSCWKDEIKNIKVRFWQNRPSLYHWKRYLETGKWSHFRKYEFWAKFNLLWRQPMYQLKHMAWMAYVAESIEVKAAIVASGYVPVWNHLIHALCNNLTPATQEQAKNYRAKNGYQWQMEVWKSPGFHQESFYLDPDDEFKLDKDVLNYILNRNNEKKKRAGHPHDPPRIPDSEKDSGAEPAHRH